MHEAWAEFPIDIEQLDEESDCFVLAPRFCGTGVGSETAHGGKLKRSLIADQLA
jgi:hypothetical protein